MQGCPFEEAKALQLGGAPKDEETRFAEEIGKIIGKVWRKIGKIDTHKMALLSEATALSQAEEEDF